MTSKIKDSAPIVKVNDKERFNSLIAKYLTIAKKFYHEDRDYFELTEEAFYKKLITDLFVNATNFNLNNIEDYIQERIYLLINSKIECGEIELA